MIVTDITTLNERLVRSYLEKQTGNEVFDSRPPSRAEPRLRGRSVRTAQGAARFSASTLWKIYWGVKQTRALIMILRISRNQSIGCEL